MCRMQESSLYSIHISTHTLSSCTYIYNLWWVIGFKLKQSGHMFLLGKFKPITRRGIVRPCEKTTVVIVSAVSIRPDQLDWFPRSFRLLRDINFYETYSNDEYESMTNHKYHIQVAKLFLDIGNLLYKISYPYVIHSAHICIKESKHPVSPKLVPWTSLTSVLVHNMGFHKLADGVCTHCFGFNHQWSYISGAFTQLWERTLSSIWGPLLHSKWLTA